MAFSIYIVGYKGVFISRTCFPDAGLRDHCAVLSRFRTACFELKHTIVIITSSVYILIANESLKEKTNTEFRFSTRSDTNRPVQSQKQATGLKVWI